jgi:hypothetical protein
VFRACPGEGRGPPGGLVDVAQKQQVWNITGRANPQRGNEWDEAGYQLQLLMDRVPRRQ